VHGKNYGNGSISSVDMDVVGVMAAYLPVVSVCVLHSLERHYLCVCWIIKCFNRH